MSTLCIILTVIAATSAVFGAESNLTILGWNQEYLFQEIGTHPEGPMVRITNRGTRRCVENKGGSNSNGSQIQMYDCNGSSAQIWIRISLDGQYFRLKNVGSGKCMDVKDNSISKGGPIRQWTCGANGSHPSQVWRVGSQDHIVGRHSNKCVDIHEANAGNGKALHIWDCFY